MRALVSPVASPYLLATTVAALMCSGCLQATADALDGGACIADQSISASIAGEPVRLEKFTLYEERRCYVETDADGGVLGKNCEPIACDFYFSPNSTCGNDPAAPLVLVTTTGPCADRAIALPQPGAAEVSFRAANQLAQFRSASAGTIELRDCTADKCTVLLDATSEGGDSVRGCFVVTARCLPVSPAPP